MKKEIFINASMGETRLAICEDGRLSELYFEKAEKERMVGDVYYGQVAKVLKGMQAAFVNIGLTQDAFLHFSDVGDNLAEFDKLYHEEGKPPKNNRRGGNEHHLHQGQPILVQITKEPISNKGARVTTNIALPGRFLVLIPFDHTVGVSRKIHNRREKGRLKSIGREIKPNGFGIVIRTVSEGRNKQELLDDLNSLMKTWEQIVKNISRGKPPVRVHKDMDMLSSTIRDLFTNDVDRLVVDDKKMHKQISKYLAEVASSLVDRVEWHRDKDPIFDRFGIETEISKSLARKFWLKSGGYIFFDHTEALTAIDVNSGRFVGKKDHDANSLKINVEAAREIARQLRLRDIGGIIICDFIDMVEEKNRRKLQDEFLNELKADRAQVNIAPISKFGIIEMTRERVRPPLLFSISEPCPACLGTGRVMSKTTILARIERWVKRYRKEKGERSLQLMVNPELAQFLSAGTPSHVLRLSWRYWTRIKVVADESVTMEDFHFLDKEGQEDLTQKYS